MLGSDCQGHQGHLWRNLSEEGPGDGVGVGVCSSSLSSLLSWSARRHGPISGECKQISHIDMAVGAGEPWGADRGEEDTGLGTAAHPAMGVQGATSHPAPTPAWTFGDPGASFLSSCCRVSTRLSFQMEMCDQVGRLPLPFPCSHGPGPCCGWACHPLGLPRPLPPPAVGAGGWALTPGRAGCISPTHSCPGLLQLRQAPGHPARACLSP